MKSNGLFHIRALWDITSSVPKFGYRLAKRPATKLDATGCNQTTVAHQQISKFDTVCHSCHSCDRQLSRSCHSGTAHHSIGMAHTSVTGSHSSSATIVTVCIRY